MRLDTAARNSGGRWANSQESFVLGVNDPNSPVGTAVNRLSPVMSDDGTVVASLGGSRLSPSPVMSDDETVVAVGGKDEEKVSGLGPGPGPGMDGVESGEGVAVDTTVTRMEKNTP